MTTTPLRPPPVIHADLGVAWIERGDMAVYIEPDEIPAVVAALLATADRLEDAR